MRSVAACCAGWYSWKMDSLSVSSIAVERRDSSSWMWPMSRPHSLRKWTMSAEAEADSGGTDHTCWEAASEDFMVGEDGDWSAARGDNMVQGPKLEK